jgi:hypothetical protein
MTVIEISDDLAAALKAKAAAARIREISERSKPDPDGLTAQDYIDLDRP